MAARSNREEELAQLEEEPRKKGSKLQQRESTLLEAQQELEEMPQRVEGVKAILRAERDAFEETKEALKQLDSGAYCPRRSESMRARGYD